MNHDEVFGRQLGTNKLFSVPCLQIGYLRFTFICARNGKYRQEKPCFGTIFCSLGWKTFNYKRDIANGD